MHFQFAMYRRTLLQKKLCKSIVPDGKNCSLVRQTKEKLVKMKCANLFKPHTLRIARNDLITAAASFSTSSCRTWLFIYF